jgi:methylated-DNA-[protein]-cysteine S-methyltransferase
MNATVMNTSVIATPAGPLAVLASDDGAVQAAGFHSDVESLLVTAPGGTGATVAARRDLGEISRAVAAYLDGDLTALDAVPVAPGPAVRTSGFTVTVWEALRLIPPGTTVTYAALAAAAGRPAAVGPAASACSRNHTALFVPCHRVVRAGGGLGGYRWGVAVKAWLIQHERDRAAR